ncbi:VanW family protein [Syntrophothermus lipocalidus]|uniref:VanW family protein n=1 Tax=Syntrophothermus lipocalidus (strain DSM 12680 / TGB-C1) TaxID=643648 RepID=D7CK31_SYNLT|nr:VanW family protein [Syntrophothermus lipocalidus]ADI01145.1 VanW family protein [Syntrophothermus lipocalidus DSM 12680]
MLPEKKVWLIISTVIAGLLAGLGLYGFQAVYGSDLFPPGVYIGGASVGGMDRDGAAQALDEWLRSIEPIPVTFICGDFVYRTNLGEIGGRVETQKVVDEVSYSVGEDSPWWNRIWSQRTQQGNRTYPVPITYDRAKVTRVLESLRPQVEIQPENCQVKVNSNGTLNIVKEKEGKKLDIQATLEKLPTSLNTAGFEVPLVCKAVTPEIRAEDFQDVLELASYSTFYDSSNVDRSYNLTTAARALNGAMVPAGQEFSFNRRVGPRELKTGYREALVILGDQFAPGVGGGVCQVVSTLYNACLLAGLEIVERHNHSVAVSYVPVGLDATVNYGSKDFRFHNNTGGPVYLAARAGGGKMTVKIYGQAYFKQRIRLERVIDQTVPFTVTEVPDKGLAPGEKKVKQAGVRGYAVRSFRIFYDEAGNVVRREALGRDVYKPLSQITLVGPALPVSPQPEVTEPEEEDQKPVSPPAGEQAQPNSAEVPSEPSEAAQ